MRTNLSLLLEISDQLQTCLSKSEAMDFLAVAIRINQPEIACMVMDAALGILSAGAPVPPFTTYADEARDWVSFTCLTERKCYLAAIWQSMGPEVRSAFLKYIQLEAST